VISRLHNLLCLAVAASSQAAIAQFTAPAPVAHVYIQTPRGVNLYNTSPTGQLTLASGSPFKTVGLMVGTNGKYFISNGTNYVHVYAMSSTGAIGKEVSKINTALYSGAECGTTGPSVLDHTGQTLYVQHYNATNGGSYVCSAFQSFKIGSTGQLTYIGTTEKPIDRHSGPSPSLMTISGQNNYAYDIYGYSEGYETSYVDGFKRTASTGSLDHWNVAVSNAPTYDSNWSWMQFGAEADPTNHVAVAEMQEQGLPYGPFASPQLASYTLDSSGNLTTTNTYGNMPTTSVYPGVMNMSPSGKLLAIGSNVDYSACCGLGAWWGTTGLQVFHFNGANPITRYSKTLTLTPIDSIHWDKANHLYALSYFTGKLYVYTVTPTSITPVSGSPYVISSPTALIVR
jgi:hypothetical protein